MQRARRILPALVWLILIYVVTVLAEGFDPPPTEFWARLLFEVKHVIAHSFVFGVQTLLVEAALHRKPLVEGQRPSASPVVALILSLGLGQEILQSLLRHQVTPFGSAWDLLVDGSAAFFAAWGWWTSRMRRSLILNAVNRSQKP